MCVLEGGAKARERERGERNERERAGREMEEASSEKCEELWILSDPLYVPYYLG